MVAGRPRTVSPPPEEMIKLGKELVEWAKDDHAKPPRVRLAQFYSEKKHILYRDWKCMLQIEEFLPYYEEAKSLLASRCLDTSKLHHSFGHRFIRLYDRELVEAENDELRLKAELSRKKEEQEHDASARSIAQAISEISRDNKRVSGACESGKSEVEDGESLLDQGQEGE